MDTGTFEAAVRSQHGIDIDSIKLSHGQVLAAGGRDRDGRRILWDGHGRAYLRDCPDDDLGLLLHPVRRYEKYDVRLL